MRRLAEITALLALAAHLAMLAYEPLRGSDAGGSGGAAVVTLAAAPEQIDQLLREWMQAPEAETAVAAALGAFDPTPQPPPELHSLALDPAPRALVQVGAMAVPELPRAPAVETGPPSKDRPETEREAAPEKTAKRTAPASGTAMQKSGGGRSHQPGRPGRPGRGQGPVQRAAGQADLGLGSKTAFSHRTQEELSPGRAGQWRRQVAHPCGPLGAIAVVARREIIGGRRLRRGRLGRDCPRRAVSSGAQTADGRKLQLPLDMRFDR